MAATAVVEQQPHVLVVTFAVQGHLNPALQFSHRLLLLGCRVTLLTTVSGHRRMIARNNFLPDGLSIATFSDAGSSSEPSHADNSTNWSWDEFIRKGSDFLCELIDAKAEEGNPFTCLVYTLLLTWVAEVAREHNLRSALLWIQPAVVLDIFYYYVNGYQEVLDNCSKEDPSFCIDLPGLPVTSFVAKDLPSFLAPSNPYPWLLVKMKEQIDVLTRRSEPATVLVNSFDQLEPEALKTLRDNKLDIVAIGPLISRDPKAVVENEYMGWLDLQGKASVVYVSFGTIAVISKEQKEEVGRGLLRSGRPFLWVIRKDQEGKEKDEEITRWREEMENKKKGDLGRIVEWCSQAEVLSHSSVGCFVTHCGWNSTMESMCSGIPMVAFPQFADQGTNAKLVEDVWRTGVRVTVEGNGVVDGVEIGRCLDLVMGEGAVRRNAKRWKELARVAAAEGGSSHTNLKAFVNEISGSPKEAGP